jgi:hypothetical protein
MATGSYYTQVLLESLIMLKDLWGNDLIELNLDYSSIMKLPTTLLVAALTA